MNVDGTAVISAKTVWGALHGLETLSQLIRFNFATGAGRVERLESNLALTCPKPCFERRETWCGLGRRTARSRSKPAVHEFTEARIPCRTVFHVGPAAAYRGCATVPASGPGKRKSLGRNPGNIYIYAGGVVNLSRSPADVSAVPFPCLSRWSKNKNYLSTGP